MKKGDICEAVIEQYDFPNKGSFVEGERRVIIKGALEGQKVRYMVTKKKSGMAEGKVLEVLEKSPLEDVEPGCPYFGLCGGCAYQTVSYGNQLMLKERMVKKLLDKVLLARGSNSMDYRWEGIQASPSDTAYRNKMEFTFGDAYKEGPLSLGLHKKGSFHDILHVTGCEIITSDWSKILEVTQKYFQDKRVPFYHRMSHEGILRNLVVRQSKKTGEFLINLVTSTQWDTYGFTEDMTGALDYDENTVTPDVRELPAGDYARRRVLYDFVQALLQLEKQEDFQGTIAGILYTENDVLGDVVASQRTLCLHGRDFIMEEILGLRFKISPFSFFQTNTKGCEVLYEKAREYIMQAGELDGTAVGGAMLAGEIDETVAGGAMPAGEIDETATGGAMPTGEIDGTAVDGMMPAGEIDGTVVGGVTQAGEIDAATAGGAMPDKVVFDLYSGTGTIAQMMAPAAKKVIGIEIVEEAVEAAKENAVANGLTNCEFIAGDVLNAIDLVEDKPDLIILDPPRDGIHPKALEKILAFGVNEMVYISCKPTSLARDLETIIQRGYRVVKACCADQFPRTNHVECICLLSKVQK